MYELIWSGKFGHVEQTLQKLVRFPARCNGFIRSRGCDGGNVIKILVQMLEKWGKYLIRFLSTNSGNQPNLARSNSRFPILANIVVKRYIREYFCAIYQMTSPKETSKETEDTLGAHSCMFPEVISKCGVEFQQAQWLSEEAWRRFAEGIFPKKLR